MSDDDYANEYQKETAERLLHRGYAVECSSNSEIHLFITGRDSFSTGRLHGSPYYIAVVHPVPEDGYFDAHVVLRGDWDQVDE